MKRLEIALNVALLATLAMPRGVPAADTPVTDALNVELAAIAADIKKIVDKKNGGTIAVNAFTGAVRLRSASGPVLQARLAAELTKLGLTIATENYRFEVVGNYLDFEHPDSKLLGVKIVARLTDAGDGATLGEFPRFVFGEESVPPMLGIAPKLNPNGDAREMSDAFKDALKNPRVAVKNSVIRQNPASPYAIEVLVKSAGKYQPRNATQDDAGRAFVPIGKQEVYGVRLINDSNHEAAVLLAIDGLNSFSFSDEKSNYWIVAPKSHVDIVGWHKNNQKSIEFKVVDFPETAAAKLKLQPTGNIGLISAAFSASWKGDQDKPKDETTGRGTGFGQEIKFGTEKVQRQIGHVRETVVVRYER